MTRSITIGGVERADLTRLESFSFQESAYRGEAGSGGFDVDSDLGAITVPAWKNIVAIDSDGGQFYTGQSVDRGVGRGPFKEDSSARWDVQTIDINTIMDDILLRGDDANRPDETDVERMQWLIGTELPSHGVFIGTDYLLTADPEDMDAQNYKRQGVYPRSVADECAENSGKNWYLFWDEGVTDQLQIWYGAEAATERTCDYGISSVLDDIDDYGVVWAAEWPEESGLALDPSRVYSAVQVVYGDVPNQVYVSRPATAAAFKRREAVLFDSSVHKATTAAKLGEHYLDAAETEDATITVAVTVPTTHVNAFQHGQRIPIRAPHLGYDVATYMRCRTRTIEPAGSEGKNPGLYRVTLVLKPSTKVTRFGGRPITGVPGQGDGIGSGVGETAELTTGTCVTPDPRKYLRIDDGDGIIIESDGGVNSADQVASWVKYNVPYTDSVFPCPIGGGSWRGYHDEQIRLQFTAPADDPTTYLGMQVEIDVTAIAISGYVAGYTVKLMHGTAASQLFGAGIEIASGPTSGTAIIYLPRSVIDWGAVNCVVLSPNWLCARPVQFCNGAVYFGNPHADGRAESGSYDGFAFSDICTVQFATDTTGLAPGVSGVGDVDGVNATFTLIGWDGTGGVTATINGLGVGAASLTLDPGTASVTFTAPPPADSVVLFTYQVG